MPGQIAVSFYDTLKICKQFLIKRTDIFIYSSASSTYFFIFFVY
ncbi:Uncharacterized protein dnm_013020 [Desulfonema magnum]|uniref:Uncharacterized protein n=1 Tax=Desulfonema magnum TaxID=45655 RepID=A0A975BGX2_9BACT|nr:Uncharacterized protein dnm_013020 [Desulfonema magnum]